MIVGIGTDIIEPARIARAMENPHFVERMYTPGERGHIQNAGRAAAERAAGLFAAKEAAVKALGCGFSGLGFHDVEILPDAAGCPRLNFSGRALDKARAKGCARTHVSIAHVQSAATAFVILESE